MLAIFLFPQLANVGLCQQSIRLNFVQCKIISCEKSIKLFHKLVYPAKCNLSPPHPPPKQLKGISGKETKQAVSKGIECLKNRLTSVFQLICDLVSKFESPENTAVSTAILCLAVCVCDSLNKVHGKSVHYIFSPTHPFFFLSFCSSFVRSKPTWLHPDKLKFEGEKYFFYDNGDNIHMKLDNFS